MHSIPSLAGTGTLSTTHSHSAESTMDRLASRVAQGGVLSVEEAYRQIAHNIHLFIYVKLVDETWKGGTRRRYVSEIRQVTRAIEHGRPVTHLTYHATGSSRALAVSGIVAITAGLLIVGGLLGILTGLRRRTPPAASRRAESTAERWARLTRRPPGPRGRRRDVI